MSAGATGRRWLAVGRSDSLDSATAAATAARAAMTGAEPKLVIVFSAITHDPAAVLDGVRQVASGMPVVGCTTHGEIGPGGPTDGTVTVAALGGPGITVSTAVAEGVAGRQRDAGAEVARCAEPLADQPHRVLMLLTDGFVRDQESILRGVYSVLGAGVPLFGGASADGWRMTGSHLFAGDRVLSDADAVVAVTIASEAPLAVGVRHGYRKVGDAMIVTSSGGGRIQTRRHRRGHPAARPAHHRPRLAEPGRAARPAGRPERPTDVQVGGAGSPRTWKPMSSLMRLRGDTGSHWGSARSSRSNSMPLSCTVRRNSLRNSTVSCSPPQRR
ncbi:FIST signal transduction protein [Dactylosporangium cerinum]|uniref:FIST signal transduction protein n=1 Tax=Dactylosporangium cerinum TaxID=1434730 RepID=A0ABV9VW82_9ACTN